MDSWLKQNASHCVRISCHCGASCTAARAPTTSCACCVCSSKATCNSCTAARAPTTSCACCVCSSKATCNSCNAYYLCTCQAHLTASCASTALPSRCNPLPSPPQLRWSVSTPACPQHRLHTCKLSSSRCKKRQRRWQAPDVGSEGDCGHFTTSPQLTPSSSYEKEHDLSGVPFRCQCAKLGCASSTCKCERSSMAHPNLNATYTSDLNCCSEEIRDNPVYEDVPKFACSSGPSEVDANDVSSRHTDKFLCALRISDELDESEPSEENPCRVDECLPLRPDVCVKDSISKIRRKARGSTLTATKYLSQLAKHVILYMLLLMTPWTLANAQGT